jgi:hypothetical protein
MQAPYELDGIESWAKYADVMTRLLVFVLRAVQLDDGARPFDVNDNLRDSILTMQGALSNNKPKSDVVQDVLQHLARAVYDHPLINPSDAARTPLVVATYLFNLRTGTGEFLPPSSTTFYTAAITWTGRVVALEEILRRHWLDPTTPVWTIAQGVFPSIKNEPPSAWSHVRE